LKNALQLTPNRGLCAKPGLVNGLLTE